MLSSGDHSSQQQTPLQENAEHSPTEQAFQGTDQRLGTLLESIAEAVITLDTQWRFTYVNCQAEAIFGKTRYELLGRSIWEVFPMLFDMFFYAKAHEAMDTQMSLEYMEFYSPQCRWFVVRLSPSQDGLSAVFQDITRRKQAEEQLKASEERFRSLSHCSPVGIFVTDIEGKAVYINPRWQEITGFASVDNLGEGWVGIVHPDDLAAFQCIRMKAIQEGREYEAEYRAVKPNGSIRWFRVKSAPMLSDAGELLGRTGTVEDVTERKQAQEAQAKLAAIVESAADAIFWITTEGMITSWNEGAERIFGFSAEEAVGKHIRLLSPPEYQRDFVMVIENMRRGARMYPFETTRLRKDGTLIPVSFIASPIKDATGEMIGVSAIARDITEQKRLEVEVRHSQRQLEAIFQHVADGIIVQDADGKVIYANQAAVRLTGAHSVEALLTTSPLAALEQFNMTDEQGHPFSWASLSRNRAVPEEVMLPIKLRWAHNHTQEVRWIALTVTSVCEENDLPYLLITVIREITQEKELEQRKDDFIINVNHELRTPLAAVSGYLALLNEYGEQLEPTMKEAFLHKAIDNCAELTRLVNSVLDALKVVNTVQLLHAEELSLAQVVREVLDLLDPQKAQAYAIQVEISEQLRVWAEKGLVYQVLNNLLANVFKYVPERTPVVIAASPWVDKEQGSETAPAQVCIRVQDAGPGIPPTESPLLFQKFVRLQRDLSGTVRGTGLGLYVCKQLVEKMGGHIWVESSGRAGEGCRFCFTLPASHLHL